MNHRLRISLAILANFSLVANQLLGQLPPISFESPVFVPWEPIQNHSANGWNLLSGSANVTPLGDGVGGGQGLRLPQSQQEAWLRRDITWDTNEKTAFIDFQIKPAAEPEGSLATLVANGTQVAFQVPAGSSNGQLWAFHGGDGPNGSSQWYVTPGAFVIAPGSNVASNWTRVTLRQDYDRNLWDLFIDGKLAAVNLAFEGRGANLTAIDFFGSRHGDTKIDDVSAQTTNMLFPDADKDGLPDSWETANGSNPNLYDRDAINPLTGQSFLEGYLSSLWPAGSAVANGTTGVGNIGTIPPLTIIGDHVPVGALKGAFAVGADGSSSYSVPIELPKGTGGMEPKISLGYSSSGGNGIVGLGWGINGFQRITRGPASFVDDGAYDPVDFDTNDRFYLDGERLVCVSGTYGAPGSEYRTELDSYARITAIGVGPASWKVETKAGLIVSLGATADARAQTTQGTLSWNVDRVQDTVGNYYTVEYTRDAATADSDLINDRPSAVHYTGNTAAGVAPYCHVYFDYEDRTDTSRAYTPHAGYKVTKRLAKIRAVTDGYTNHSYKFAYETSHQSDRSMLKSIQKLANDDPAKAIPATTFNYDGLAVNEAVWKQEPTLFSGMDLYTYSQDDPEDVIITSRGSLAVVNGGKEISITGEAARRIPLGSAVPLYSDSVMTFEFKSDNLSSGGLVGFDDATYSNLPYAYIYGTNSNPRNYLGNLTWVHYSQAGTWIPVTLPLGGYQGSSPTSFSLGCVDDINHVDPAANLSIRNVKIYRTGSQQPGDVEPIVFQAPSWADAGFPVDKNTVFFDVDCDGLVDCCRYLVKAYPRNNTTGRLVPTTAGEVYRNTGRGFVRDPSLNPPSNLAPIATGNEAISYENKHLLTSKAVDINADGKLDLVGPDEIYYLSNSLINGLEFQTYNGTQWTKLNSYTMPFRIKNLASGVSYGGDARTHYQEWSDLDRDGYPDLLIATTAKGQLVDPVNAATVLMGVDSSTVWLNKVHLGQGWVRTDALKLPVPLTEGYPTRRDVGRRLFDFNGDGLLELVESTSTASNTSNIRKSFRLNTAASGSLTGWNGTAITAPPAFAWDLPLVNSSREANASLIDPTGTGKDMGTRILDLNGDGLQDVVRSTVQSNQLLRTFYLNQGGRTTTPWKIEPKPSGSVLQQNTYDLPFPLAFYSGTSIYSNGAEFGDLNGDGLTDVMYAHGSSGYNSASYLNNGNGWKIRPEWLMPTGLYFYNNATDAQNGTRRSMLQDLNGDGFPDLVTGMTDAAPKVWINQCRPEVLTSVTDGYASEIQVEYRRMNDPSESESSQYSLGGRVYQAFTGNLPIGHAAVIDSRLVVSRYSEPDGMGGRRYKSQRYGDLRYDRTNGASLGFGWIEQLDEMNGQRSRTQMMRTYPFSGSAAKVETFVYVTADDLAVSYPGLNPGLKLVSVETAEYAELPSLVGVGGTIRRPIQIQSETKSSDLNGDESNLGTIKLHTTTQQALTDFDVYGFVGKSTVTSLDGTTVVTESSFNHNVDPNKWHLGRLASSTVTKSGGSRPTLIKTAGFTYSSTTGLVESETAQAGHPLSMTKSYGRDAFGNITTTIVAASGESRTSTAQFDGRGRFPVYEKNHLGRGISYQYDQQKSLLISTTDIAGKTAWMHYDAFGTLIRTDQPGGTQLGEITGFASNSSLPAAVAGQIGAHQVKYFKAEEKSGSPVSKMYFDAMGRELVSEATILKDATASGPTRYAKVYGVTQYDTRGRKAAASLPFVAGETPLFTVFSYDCFDRLLTTVHPDGKFEHVQGHSTSTLVTYGVPVQPTTWSHTMAANGMSLQRWEDQHGRFIATRDSSNQITTFHHDQEGRLLRVALNGVTLLTNSYDIFGNKTSVSEVNSGTTTSEFNGFGEVVSTTNAKGQITTFTYDAIGRRTSVNKPEGTFYFYYDHARGNGIGMPWKTTGPSGYEEEVSYDALGRPAATRKTQFGETFTTAVSYDILGRPLTSTDAGGLVTLNSYDPLYSFPVAITLAGGSPGTSVVGAGTVLWAAGISDSSGRAVTQTLAQGVQTSTSYDPGNGLATALSATHAGITVQNKSYQWDGVGNLTWRIDAILRRTEVFGYDHLNRLSASSVVATGGGTTTTVPPPESYTYDSLGNLKTKGLTTLTYGPSGGIRPHGVTHATVKGFNRIYSYDAAGHVVNDSKRVYTWTSFGQLSSVAYASSPKLKDGAGIQLHESGDVFSAFDFDATGNRVRQVKERLVPTASSGQFAKETTLYLGSYEREVHETNIGTGGSVTARTTHRHSFGAVVYTRSESPNGTTIKLTTVLKDHLGSTDVLLVGTWNGTAFSPSAVERQVFDPWGERRRTDFTSARTADSDPFLASAHDYDRGYTGHEHLDDSGLIHMNGRIYDPELGRFLSPDPYVQMPDSSQNFNRYSYVLNNPLNATDPSGFFFLSKLFHKKLEFLKENWRTVVVIVVVAIVTIVSAGSLTAGAAGVGAAILGGTATAAVTAAVGGWAVAAIGGAFLGGIAGGLTAALNGGDMGDILRGAVVGGIQGGITAGLLHGMSPEGAGYEAGFNAETAMHVAGHGVVGGAANAAMGGSFQDGFISAAVSAAAADAGAYSFGSGTAGIVARTAMAGVVGGTVSVIGGGKFANGAYLAAFQHYLNAESGQHTSKALILVGEGGSSGGMFDLAAKTALAANPDANVVKVGSGADMLSAIQAHYNQYGPIAKLLVFSHGGTHALYIHQSTEGNNSLYTDRSIPIGPPGPNARYVSQIDSKYFSKFGYACLYACKPGGEWGFAHVLSNRIGKGFIVEANTTGLNFTGVSGGKMKQGLPAIVPANYKGTVYLQDTEGAGQWNMWREGKIIK